MRYQIVFVGFICIIYASRSNANNKCFIAKTCVHDAKEKCGENRNGELRRFLDNCDMKEYNCLQRTDYSKVSLERCQNLPPIDGKSSKSHREEVDENQSKSSHVDRGEIIPYKTKDRAE